MMSGEKPHVQRLTDRLEHGELGMLQVQSLIITYLRLALAPDRHLLPISVSGISILWIDKQPFEIY